MSRVLFVCKSFSTFYFIFLVEFFIFCNLLFSVWWGVLSGKRWWRSQITKSYIQLEYTTWNQQWMHSLSRTNEIVYAKLSFWIYFTNTKSLPLRYLDDQTMKNFLLIFMSTIPNKWDQNTILFYNTEMLILYYFEVELLETHRLSPI